MSKWGKPTKNRKRIDPRYFINETTNRDLKEYATAGGAIPKSPVASLAADPPYAPELDMDNVADMQAALANQPAADPEYVLRALKHHYNRGVHPSQRRGMPFSGMGVDPIMDALGLDDVWDEEEEALQKVVSDGDYQTIEEFAVLVTDWFTKKRRGLHLTDEGQAKQMARWR